MHRSSTPRRRVHIRQTVPRSAVRGGLRVQRVLLASLILVCAGAPAVKLLRSLADEHAMERRARYAVASPVRATSFELAPVPVTPPTRQGWAAQNGAELNFARAGSTPAPVTHPWETAFLAPGPVAPLTTTADPQIPARTVVASTAGSGRRALDAVLPPIPASPLRGAVTVSRSPLSLISSAPLGSLVAATNVPTAGGNDLLAPTHSAAALAPHTRLAEVPRATARAVVQPDVTPGSFTWSGAAVAAGSPPDPNWTTNNNWVGSIAPNPTASANIVYTPTPAGATATNVNVDYQINSLTFQGPVAGVPGAPDTPSYNVTQTGASDLSIGAGGIMNASANAQTLSLPVYATADQTWTVSNASGRLNLPVQAYLQGLNRVLTVDGAGTTAITGPVNEGTNVTAAQIIKNGVGTLILAGNNTYSGGTTLNAGTIELDNDRALGTGTFTVGPNGGTVTNQAVASGTPFPISVTIPNAVALNGNLDRGASNADLTFTGAVNLGAATRTITASDPNFNYLTFSGPISGAAGAGLTFSNALQNTIFLAGSAANTYTGTTTVDNAAVYLGKSGVVAVPGNLTIQNNGFVSNSGLVSATGGQLAPTTNLVVNTGGEFDASGGFSNSANESVASLNGDSTGFVSFGNQFTQTYLTVAQGNYAGTLRDGFVREEERPSGATAAAAPTTGGALIKTTTGIFTVSGNNTYSGGTTIYAGRLLVNNDPSPGISGTGSGPVQVNSGTLGGTGRIAGDVTVSANEDGPGHLAPGNFVTVMTLTAQVTPALAPPNPNIGTLTVDSSVTFQNGSSFDAQFDSNSATADALVVFGGVIISQGATFLGTELGSTMFAAGTTLTLIDNRNESLIDGVFSNLPDKSTVQIGQTTFTVNYEGGTGNDLVFTAAIPEPGTIMLLLSMGGLGIAARCLSRRR